MSADEQQTGAAAPTTAGGIRVVVADDARELRELVVKLLRRDPRITVVAEGSDTPTTLTAVLEHRPDVLLVDLSMPGGGGLLVISQLQQRAPEVRVVVLSGLPREQAEDAAFAAGACAYVEKGTSIKLVVDAVLTAGGLV
jgi:two-component system invasion response regulator UvrY